MYSLFHEIFMKLLLTCILQSNPTLANDHKGYFLHGSCTFLLCIVWL